MQVGWFISSCVVAVTLPISIWDIVMHLRNMHQPLIQARVRPRAARATPPCADP